MNSVSLADKVVKNASTVSATYIFCQGIYSIISVKNLISLLLHYFYYFIDWIALTKISYYTYLYYDQSTLVDILWDILVTNCY